MHLPRTSLTPFAVAAVLLSASAAARPPTAAIDDVVERAMDVFDVPGLAVTVVQGNDLRHAAGYGVLEDGRPEKVDADTLFRIGSVSKAFTAAALALLADEGRLAWDDRVIDYLPEFRLSDPWVTREFTIRDLLTHRSGLPLGAGDLLMFPDGNATPAEVVQALRHLKPATSFRSEF
ncbi:MAG TPA: serine hydrolase domain-containing protein, partial [Woeseiaceae bacterium]|nr:serine hydrolase domain-containing protein [Woeseiaceae bacterium]